MVEKETTGMKKPSSKIREEIARLQEQLKQAETREAERIGRLALKAGLGDIEIEERALVTAFEELVVRFRKGSGRAARPAFWRCAPAPGWLSCALLGRSRRASELRERTATCA